MKQTLRQRTDLWLPGSREGLRGSLGLAHANYLYRPDRQQGPYSRYSTGNYIQYPVINHNGKEYKTEFIYN